MHRTICLDGKESHFYERQKIRWLNIRLLFYQLKIFNSLETKRKGIDISLFVARDPSILSSSPLCHRSAPHQCWNLDIQMYMAQHEFINTFSNTKRDKLFLSQRSFVDVVSLNTARVALSHTKNAFSHCLYIVCYSFFFSSIRLILLCAYLLMRLGIWARAHTLLRMHGFFFFLQFSLSLSPSLFICLSNSITINTILMSMTLNA